MTLRIEIMQLALGIEARHIPKPSVRFGHAAPDPAVAAAALISVASVLIGIARITGML